MNALVIPVTLFLTIVFSMAFGILAGYFSVMALLRAFGHSRAKSHPASATFASVRTASGGD